MEKQGGPYVLRFRPRVHTADILYRSATEDHIRTDAERSVEAVATWLDEAIEHRLHEPGTARDQVLDVAVGLRSLHESDVGVDEEWHGLVEEVLVRHEVRIEDREILTIRECQRMVDVSCLLAAIAEATNVARTDLGSEVPHGVRAAVVENPRGVFAPHRECRAGCAAHDGQRFAVHGDEHVDSDALVGHENRPLLRARARTVAFDVLGVEDTFLCVMEGEGAGVLRAGEYRPHRHECLGDQDDFRSDHEAVWQPVSAVCGVQEKERVGEHADRGRQHKKLERRRIGGAILGSTGERCVFCTSGPAVGPISPRCCHCAVLHSVTGAQACRCVGSGKRRRWRFDDGENASSPATDLARATVDQPVLSMSRGARWCGGALGRL